MNASQRKRATLIRKALRKIYGEHEDTETMVIDALTDLRHLCDADNVDMSNCDRIARGHYCTERQPIPQKAK